MKNLKLFSLSLALVAMMGLSFAACNRGDDNAPQDTGFASSPIPSSTVPQSTNSPQNVAETPPPSDSGHPEVVFNNQGVGTIFNPTGHDVTYRSCVYNSAVLRSQIYLGQSNPVTAPPKSDSTQIPFPELDLQCGTTYRLQIDPWKSTSDCPKDAYSIDERGRFLDITTDSCECDDYEPPTVNITGELKITDSTDTSVTVNGSATPLGGSWSTPLPTDVDRPLYGQDPGLFTNTYSVAVQYGPENFECFVRDSKEFSVQIQPRHPNCDDLEPPTIEFTDNTNLTETQLTGSIDALPSGGSWNPAQAFPYDRPAYGQSPLNLHFDYTVFYGKQQELECQVTKGIDKAVPPQEDFCEEEWIEQEPEIEYGEWGECSPADFVASNDVLPQCSRSRTNITIIEEVNSCTEERRVKSREDTLETEPCECPVVCANSEATSDASMPFTLNNSGEATETAWVNANVSPGPYAFWFKNQIDGDQQCTTAASSAPVVLLKAGRNYWYFLNVLVGQQLCSGAQQAISHISYFDCAGLD